MPVVCDSSPLIIYARTGRLHFLRDLFGEVVIPPAVEVEVTRSAASRPGAHEVASAEWIKVAAPQRPPVSHRLPARLGKGEAEAIALTLEAGAMGLLVIDASDGRRVAREHGVHVLGSVGVLLLAKSAQLIPTVRPVLDDVRASGLYLSDRMYQLVLEQAGEG